MLPSRWFRSEPDARPRRLPLPVIAALLAGVALIAVPMLLLSTPDPRAPRIAPDAEDRSLTVAARLEAPRPEDAPRADRSLTVAARPEDDQPYEDAWPTAPVAEADPEPTIERTWRRDDPLTQAETRPRDADAPPATAPTTAPAATPATSAIDTEPASSMDGGAASGRSPRTSVSERRRNVQALGGDANTENAVDAGLNWLAAHQNEDGTWSRTEFQRHCPPGERCGGVAIHRLGPSLNPGLTGLSLLAFLGAGYTDRSGPHQDTVERAARALLRWQQPDGGFSADPVMAGYNDPLAAFALAELYAQTGDESLRDPLRRVVDRLVRSQQPLGGWDYTRNPASGRNDTSITAWYVQALQSAAAVGIEVAPSSLIRAALHIARATEPDGRVWYADQGTGFRVDPQSLEPVRRYGPAMIAAGLTCEQLLGWDVGGDMVRRQQALLLAEPPTVSLHQGRDPTQLHGYYYWYYGTIAMFQAGGPLWERWNASLRDAILPLQERLRPGDSRRHRHGSWPPFGPNWGKWGRMGGRVYSTAISVLTLETYYRQTPAYLQSPAVLTAADWVEYLRAADARQQRLAVDALAGMRLEIGEPALVDLLDAGDPQAAIAAAVALSRLDSPVGLPVLERARRDGAHWPSTGLDQAIARCRALAGQTAVGGRLRLYDTHRRLATLEMPGAYLGMAADVMLDGRPAARFRVIRRHSGNSVVVAERQDTSEYAPSAGDAIVGRYAP